MRRASCSSTFISATQPLQPSVQKVRNNPFPRHAASDTGVPAGSVAASAGAGEPTATLSSRQPTSAAARQIAASAARRPDLDR
ncbi:MAG: hypothetical protein QM739_17255 [Propionivibrio sp.]